MRTGALRTRSERERDRKSRNHPMTIAEGGCRGGRQRQTDSQDPAKLGPLEVGR